MDADARYRALASRDARFDGVFYVGVTTTGVYCRPVCTARLAARDRCVFFESVVEAEREGFRACFRCRPELAPGSAAGGSNVDAVRVLARRAAARIEAGACNEGSVDDLARELGVTPRHLTRAMQRELGLSPIELAQSCRLALAKKLLQDTRLPIVDVAFASGFSSVRRFNDAFRARFARAPSSVKRGAVTPDGVPLVLGVRPPFAWRELLAFLRPRAIPGVEIVDETKGTYARTVAFDSTSGVITASFEPARRALRLDVSTTLIRSLMEITARARALFDLDAVPTAIDAHLRADPALRASVHAHPGLRVPGAWSGFELGVRAILGQQVTVAHATALAGRLVHALGDPVSAAADGLERAFPTPRAVAQAGPASLRELGITTRRSQTLCDLAAAVRDGHIDLTRQANVASTLSALTSIAGVGPWTAQVIAMRALGVTDALPPGDAGLLRVTKQIESRSARWSPWRSYAVMHVWTGGMT